jgi:hypothetical protein
MYIKTKLLYPLLAALVLLSFPVLAQEDAPTSKPSAIAPYKTAVGIRYSPTPAYGGSELTFTAKHFIRPESALEANIGFIDHNRAFMTSLQYVWQPQLLTFSRLRPYAGIGLGLTGNMYNNRAEKQPLETNLVILNSIGVEYTFPKIPVAVSLDYRHAFASFKYDDTKDLPKRKLNTIALGLKYTFGK